MQRKPGNFVPEGATLLIARDVVSDFRAPLDAKEKTVIIRTLVQRATRRTMARGRVQVIEKEAPIAL